MKRDCSVYVVKTKTLIISDKLRGYSAADLHLCFGIFRKHVITETSPYKSDPDFHLTYSKIGGNLWSESI